MRRSILFVALYLILAGVTTLVANLFHLRISILAVLFAEGLIMLGIYIIANGGKWGKWPDASNFAADEGEQRMLFGSGGMSGSPETRKYTVLFSSATITLPEDIPDMIEINCIFSDARVILPPNRAVRVRLSATFGTAGMPGGNVSGFGSREMLLGKGVASYMAATSLFGSLYIV